MVVAILNDDRYPKLIDITGDQPYTRPAIYTAIGAAGAYVFYLLLGWQGCLGVGIGIALSEIVRQMERRAGIH